MKNIITGKVLIVAFLVAASLACATTATNTTANTNISTNSANTNSAVVSDPSATPAKQSNIAPDALVADLYKQHDAQKGPFFQTKNRALLDKYFTKSLADIIWKDAIESKGEVGALDADPLYDAQDTEIKNFKIGQAEIKGSSATVPVAFNNYDEKKNLTFVLTQENGSWKIEDIKYGGDSGSLTGIFKANSSADSGGKTDSSPTGEFEGKYQIGETTCTVKPIKMAFEVKWEKGTGTEIFFFQDRANDKYIFASDPPKGKANVFSFDDENYNTGTFYRADGKEFPIKRIK